MSTTRVVWVLAENEATAIRLAMEYDWHSAKPIHAYSKGYQLIIGDVHPDDYLWEIHVTLSTREY